LALRRGEKKVWQIVGEPEADANKGKISVASPIARALIGKNKGDTVEAETPSNTQCERSQEKGHPHRRAFRRRVPSWFTDGHAAAALTLLARLDRATA
jgi:hypothetical protein